MPKILPHLREQLLNEARDILYSEGYSALSIRRLAKTCGIAPGTVYNHFRSKDDLTAVLILSDWTTVLRQMEASVDSAADMPAGVEGIFRALRGFVERQQDIWQEFLRTGGRIVGENRHQKLREQIAGNLSRLADRFGYKVVGEIAPLLAETVLAAAMQTDIPQDTLITLTRLICQSNDSSKGGHTHVQL